MICSKCDSQNAEQQLFCSRCGSALGHESNHPRLGEYRLVAKIGEGGMGIVYQAIGDTLDREVAIKIVHPHLLRDQELVSRFRREAKFHSQLINPNIVTLLSVYESDRNMALIMEMVHGVTLKEYLRNKIRPKLMDVLKISDGILSGLSAAHKLNLVHRDLKPANVMIGHDNSVKLMDFGLAKSQTAVEDITKSGATVGSFRYMAPEQILNKDIDARTDLYSFGILLYQMVCGHLPFDITGSGGEFEIMEKQVRHAPKSPREVDSKIPLALEETILSLLSKNPDDRPRSCAETRKMLANILPNLKEENAGRKRPMKIGAPMNASNFDILKGLLKAATRKMGAPFKRIMGGSDPGKSRPVMSFTQTMTMTAQHMAASRSTLFWLLLSLMVIVSMMWISIPGNAKQSLHQGQELISQDVASYKN